MLKGKHGRLRRTPNCFPATASTLITLYKLSLRRHLFQSNKKVVGCRWLYRLGCLRLFPLALPCLPQLQQFRRLAFFLQLWPAFLRWLRWSRLGCPTGPRFYLFFTCLHVVDSAADSSLLPRGLLLSFSADLPLSLNLAWRFWRALLLCRIFLSSFISFRRFLRISPNFTGSWAFPWT